MELSDFINKTIEAYKQSQANTYIPKGLHFSVGLTHNGSKILVDKDSNSIVSFDFIIDSHSEVRLRDEEYQQIGLSEEPGLTKRSCGDISTIEGVSYICSLRNGHQGNHIDTVDEKITWK